MKVAIPLIVLTALTAPGSPPVPSPEAGVRLPGDSAEAWFLRDLDALTQGTGRWLTDNGAYVGPDEPWRTYGLEWRKGLSGRTGHGRLFGVDQNSAERDFWEFYVYWDALRGTGVALQVHTSGTIFGVGDMTWTVDGMHELVQTFRWSDASTRQVKHIERYDGTARHTQSFDWVDVAWQPRRTYRWTRDPGPRDRSP